MRMILLILALSVVIAAIPAAAAAAEEAELIGVLLSDAPAAQKDAACKRLKQVGTAASVAALAACLADDELSLPARQALETMHAPEAGEALLAALDTTDGLNRVGVVDSLGMRGEMAAVPALAALLTGPDAVLASAAARSLGRIGSLDAVDPLKQALQAGNTAAIGALLRCAEQLPPQNAYDIAAYVYGLDLPEDARVAAYRAKILAAGDKSAELTVAGITGTDKPARMGALSVAASLPGADITQALAVALAEVDAPAQEALLRALGDRAGGAAPEAAVNAVANAAASDDEAVRLAALRTLGRLGGAQSVGLLAKIAAGPSGADRDAAREALTLLRGEDVGGELLRLIRNAPASEQVELIGAIARRRQAHAAEELVRIAMRADEPVQLAALRALGGLGDDSCAYPLIAAMCAAPSEAYRAAAQDALVRIAGRSANPGAVVDGLFAVQTSEPAQLLAILTAAARIDFAKTLPRLDAALDHADQDVRDALVRVIVQYCGPESMPRLLDIAGRAENETHRALALRAYWRAFDLTAQEPAEQRFEMAQAGLALAKSADARKAGIAALAEIPLSAALDAANRARADEAVTAEADLAAYTIATKLAFTEQETAAAALTSLAATAVDERLRGRAARTAAILTGESGFVVPWLVSAPYRAEGKEAQDLFDIEFAPEKGGEVEWRPQPVSDDPENLWFVDLYSAVGGDHCVVYLKTRVFSENGGATAAEIGSDDGIKLWVNGELVHANNVLRGFAPDQDRAEITLEPGWNDFLAKITQHTAGCAFGIRLPEHLGRVAPE